VLRELPPVLRKARRQLLKDYAIFPLLAGPFFLPVLAGNLGANLIRNVWAFAIIFCGHFTADVETFPESVVEDETRGEWYLRQLKGSGNLDGGPVFHILSGNLSHQIEHHLFPDVPATRYAEMAVEVRRIAAKYGQHYETGSFARQFSGVVRRIFRYALPDGALD
jgi:linoleoyl-CoA desaturase